MSQGEASIAPVKSAEKAARKKAWLTAGAQTAARLAAQMAQDTKGAYEQIASCVCPSMLAPNLARCTTLLHIVNWLYSWLQSWLQSRLQNSLRQSSLDNCQLAN
jgi:hypothetical protein